MSIPKKIHYCWFGRGQKSELIKKCMDSWKKYCPDWEIIEWNEDNIDVNCCPYSARAYKKKLWGYVPDPLRMKIIYEHGGVYLDTDVELVHSLDELCEYSSWFGYGTDTQVNTGSGFGAEKGNPFIKKILDHYMSLSESSGFLVCTEREEQIFHEMIPGFYANKWLKKDQLFGGNNIILWDIWKYTNHHYTGSWLSPMEKIFNRLPLIPGIYFRVKRMLKTLRNKV